MKKTEIYAAQTDWNEYIAVYNRCMTFAPYSAPLTRKIVEERVIPFMERYESCALIARKGEYGGIMHVSRRQGADGEAALHLLLSDDNDVAETLLRYAENWAAERGEKKLRSYSLFFNPYMYIQHGFEAYCWGGLYPARNAFFRRKWDLDLDIVNMFLDMETEPEIYDAGFGETDIKEDDLQESDLYRSGKIDVYYRGESVATGGYIYLKRVSEWIGKPVGQIWLHSEERFYGKGFAKTAITACHGRLYALGARRVILATNNALFRAIRFYYALGYRQEPIHAFIFSKKLK